MRRIVVTGISCLGPVAGGVEQFAAAFREERPLGHTESVDTLRGRRRELRLCRLAPFDRETFLPAHKLRRMDELSQVWTIACLEARADAGLEATDSGEAHHSPESRATFLGTGFGCIECTWTYLETISTGGAAAANPFLFSESVANAPAGHSAIELDARGQNCTLTCGDASAVAAVAAGTQAIRDGRAEIAYCGGVELFPPPLVRVLAAAGAPAFLGEGCVCLVLESLESARARRARIYAEIAGRAAASDPGCGSTEWSVDVARMASVLRRVAHGDVPRTVRKVFLHASGSEAAESAESAAAALVFPDAPTVAVAHVFGSMAAAGGFSLALATRDASCITAEETGIVTAWSWGGGLHAVSLSGPPP